MLLGTIILEEPDESMRIFLKKEFILRMFYYAGAGEKNFARSMEIMAEELYKKDKKKIAQLDWDGWYELWWDLIGEYAVSLCYKNYTEARVDLLKMYKILIRNGKIQ